MDDKRLELISPLKNLTTGQRKDLLDGGKRAVVPKGTMIDSFEERNWFFMLVDGNVKLIPAEGKAFTFDDSTERALDPIFPDVRGGDTAKFTIDSLVIRIDRKRVEQAEQSVDQTVEAHDTELDDVGADVVRALFEDFHNGRINVPAMPEIAVRVRKLMDDENAGLEDLAKLIEQDPSLAGKLIAAANSALIRGRTEICTAEEALLRMGITRACNVVISLAVQEMFIFRSRTLYAVGSEVWMTATQVAATSKILAQHAQGVTVDPEKAFMIGLLHNVGAVAVLGYLEQLDIDVPRSEVKETLNSLRAVSTTLVLNKWHMDADFHVAGEDAEDPETRENPYFPILQLAVQQVQAANSSAPESQEIHQLPGFMMLGEHRQVDEHGRLVLLVDHPELAALPSSPGVENAA